jgi:uncharacterized membrane protein
MTLKVISIYLRASMWFVPMLVVGAAVLLAYSCLAIDDASTANFARHYPQPFAGGADSIRVMLASIATSMITVSGITFSLTISSLAQMSGQLTARVIRNFTSHITSKLVLGFFVGLFVYCIIVVRAIRIKDDADGPFIPALSVFMAMVLAIIGIGVVVYFIHYIARSVQASTVVSSVTREALVALDKLYPTMLPADSDEVVPGLPEPTAGQVLQAVDAWSYGYVQLIDEPKLRKFALDNQLALRVDAATGDYVVQRSPLVSIVGPSQAVDQTVTKAINGAFVIRQTRAIDEEIAFGIRQLVDIGLKALSGTSDDTTTAILVLDNLSVLLVNLVQRRLLPLNEDGNFVPKHPSFASLMADAMDQLRETAGGNTVVLTRLLYVLMVVGRQTRNPSRRAVLLHHTQLIAEQASTTLHTDYQRTLVQQQLSETLIALGEKKELAER